MVNGNCAVVGCTNSGYKLRKWRSELCEQHGVLRSDSLCSCIKPFVLHKFPKDRKELWIKNIRRTIISGKPWTPGSSDTVCSEHFPDGRPTVDNPDPVLKMGYEFKAAATRRPLKRNDPLPLAKKPTLSDSCGISSLSCSGTAEESTTGCASYVMLSLDDKILQSTIPL